MVRRKNNLFKEKTYIKVHNFVSFPSWEPWKLIKKTIYYWIWIMIRDMMHQSSRGCPVSGSGVRGKKWVRLTCLHGHLLAMVGSRAGIEPRICSNELSIKRPPSQNLQCIFSQIRHHLIFCMCSIHSNAHDNEEDPVHLFNILTIQIYDF